MQNPINLSNAQFEALFPCFIRTDENLVITQVGRTILKLVPEALAGQRLDRWFVVERPFKGFDPVASAKSGAALQLRSADGRIKLAGCIMNLGDGFLFCVSLSAGAASGWGKLGLTAQDFSPADGATTMAVAVSMQTMQLAEVKTLNESLRRARDQALAASQAKSNFLATMSHEIRTPLNGILGMAQAMVQDAQDEQQSARLAVVLESGGALLTILNQLLDLSRLEAGKLPLESIPFELEDVLGGVFANFSALADRDGLIFRQDIAAARGRYRGDPTRIRQIVQNLLSNAIKFTDQGQIVLSARSVLSGVEISVSDTGPGIEADAINLIFEEFRQADSSVNRRFGGAGLGLAICNELAGLMGGDLKVQSRVGEGSTFTVSLPLERLNCGAPAAVQPAPSGETTGRPADARALRVLSVDDNEINQLVMRTVLQQAGLSVTAVSDGAQAVEAAAEAEWDLILMDVLMPVMGGVEATRKIRQHEKQSGLGPVPIIAITANAMRHQVADYEGVGFDAIVSKPVDVPALIEVIEKTVNGRAASRR
jgi:signal transduction histidine kinase/ActR/RegA family two-component response regulator